jgi:hypothetical protein
MSSELEFDLHELERSTNLITGWKYERVNGVRYRRLFVQDPDCMQDKAYCPCGPVGDWEVAPSISEEKP